MSYRYRPGFRFYEADQQRVIYHMWYLAHFEDARNSLLAAGGMDLHCLQERGLDLQVVHYQIDWRAPVHWDDDAEIAVSVPHVGNSSFRVSYSESVGSELRVVGEAVYVVVALGSAETTAVPQDLRRLLLSVAA